MEKQPRWKEALWIAAWALLVFVLCLSVPKAFADRADEIEAYPATQYCDFVTTLFAAGVTLRNEGRALVFEHWAPDSLAEVPRQCTKPPIDHGNIAICDWDNYTDNERALVSQHISAGWQYADKLLAHAPPGTRVSETAAGSEYYQACASAKAREHLKKRTLHKMAATGVQAKYGACQLRITHAQWVIDRLWAGETPQSLIDQIPPEWAAETRTAAEKLVWDAAKWPRGKQDFVDYVVNECML